MPRHKLPYQCLHGFIDATREKEIISLESLPGHHHQMDYDEKLWFGSCWQMYFSTAYYKYIPKSLFDDFLACIENRVVNNLRKITLFENPQDFDLPENRLSQWKFRRAVGIDSIAHKLMKSNNRIEPDFLPVLITKKNCVAGETRVSRYLDSSGNLVAGNGASIIEIKEYLVDGTTVVFEETVKNN